MLVEKVSEYKETAISLYNDPESRPKKVAEMLVSIGADKVLSKVISEAKAEMMVEGIASITTLEGFNAKKAEITEIAKPIVAKAYTPEGRAELVADTKEFATPYVEPYVVSVKEYTEAKTTIVKDFAAPYISKVKESSEPYVAKLDEIRRSERVEAMIAAFQEAREHPAEKVGELRSKAVDLIRYENLKAYRTHVMSAEFQADTIRLVKVDLPELALKGAETVRTKAVVLSAELEAHFVTHKAKLKGLVAKGREMAAQVELEAVKAKVMETTGLLITELQAEIAASVEVIKADGLSKAEVVERLKRVAAVVDKLVLTPLKGEVSALTAKEAVPDEATNATVAPPAPPPVKNGAAKKNGVPKSSVPKAKAPAPSPAPTTSSKELDATDDETMVDASEDL